MNTQQSNYYRKRMTTQYENKRIYFLRKKTKANMKRQNEDFKTLKAKKKNNPPFFFSFLLR